MKKVIFALLLAVTLVSCGSAVGESIPESDSTLVAIDTTVVVIDTTVVMAVDTMVSISVSE
jgi:hypothetical protein